MSEVKKPNTASYLILFEVEDDRELSNVTEYLERHEVSYEKFYEPDYDMGHTAICTEPMYDKQRRLFKKFKLWK